MKPDCIHRTVQADCPAATRAATRATPRIATWAIALAVALGLGGCASLDRSMESMAMGHNETMQRIERNTTLLNVLRAAEDQPLAFTSVSYVSGNGSIGGNANLSESRPRWLGQVLNFSTSVGLNANQGFSYSLGSLDNEQFTRSFLAEVPIDRLFFLSEGTRLDNGVLWTLLVQSLNSGYGGPPPSQPTLNRVDRKDWAAFQQVLAYSLLQGLALEQYAEQVPVGPRLSRDEALYQVSMVVNGWNPPGYGVVQAGAGRPLIVEAPGEPADKPFQIVMTSDKTRFCFNPPELKAWPHEASYLCRGSGAQREFRALRSQGATPALDPLGWKNIAVRSPREVFYFLGEVVREQLRQPGQAWAVGDASVDPSRPPRPLFTVVCGVAPTGEALAEAQWRGQRCHVPAGDGSHSAQVLQYLNLLVTLSKVPGALPNSPAVLVR